MVLDRYILLATEAAAHQTVPHPHLFRRKAQHSHDLVLGIIGTLIRGKDGDALPLRVRHGTFRLQKGVLCPRR